jgi:hypothetical protein
MNINIPKNMPKTSTTPAMREKPLTITKIILMGNRSILMKIDMSLVVSDSGCISAPQFVQKLLCCSVEEQLGQMCGFRLVISSLLRIIASL